MQNLMSFGKFGIRPSSEKHTYIRHLQINQTKAERNKAASHQFR